MPEYKLNPLLTDASWQVKKGSYAKLAGETGMGAVLIRMNSAFKAVDWEFIEFMPILDKATVIGWGKAKILERQKFAKKNCQKAAVFETELGKVIVVAKATKKKFEDSKLPNIATGKKAADDIIKAANQMKADFDKKPYKLTYNQWDDFVTRFGSLAH